MKKAPLYISIATVAAGISAFTFLGHQSEYDTPATDNPKVILTSTSCSAGPSKPVFYGPEFTGPSTKLYNVRKRFTKRITKAQIKDATLINDFLPHYPGGWIVEYISVKIIADVKGETKMAIAPDNHLTPEQKALLRTLEPMDGIFINIDYKAENSITGEMEASKMEWAMGIIPDIEAEFPGGQEALINYLADNSWDKITAQGFEASEMKTTAIRFTINQMGKPENIEVFVESGNEKVDAVLKETIAKMPQWIPAENFDGEKAKQQFEFILGDGC